ncbi:mechanosensitive ion channel [bacterium]|nr:mechanosensitive ion channel [candidate division CSSED10-310 bacterium]
MRCLLLPALFFLILCCPVLAQDASDKPLVNAITGGLPDPAVMVIFAVSVLLIGGAIGRVLWRTRLVNGFFWIILIFCSVSGAFWTILGRFYSASAVPYRFAQLFSFFLISILLLYLIVRFLLPSSATRTRASIPSLVRNLAVFAMALIVLFILLVSLFPELNLTPVFFTSGVLSIVIGLAVQDVLTNLLAGLVLSIDKPFDLGDWVHFGDMEGEVVKTTWRTTKIRNLQNDYIELPNSLISRERLVNHNTPTSIHMRKVYVGVTYDTPPALACEALLEAVSRVEGVRKSPSPEIHFKDYLDSSLLYEVRIWIDNYGSYPVIESDTRKEIWYAFKRHDITIPFPIRDVNLKQVQDLPMQYRARLITADELLKGKIFELTDDRTTIGRDPHNTVVVNNPQVSKHHADIVRDERGYRIADRGSRHGTFLNGTRITEALLQRGDEISLGGTRLLFETNLAPVTGMESDRPEIRIVRQRTDHHPAPDRQDPDQPDPDA